MLNYINNTYIILTISIFISIIITILINNKKKKNTHTPSNKYKIFILTFIFIFMFLYIIKYNNLLNLNTIQSGGMNDINNNIKQSTNLDAVLDKDDIFTNLPKF